jgi:hypothetical protein
LPFFILHSAFNLRPGVALGFASISAFYFLLSAFSSAFQLSLRPFSFQVSSLIPGPAFYLRPAVAFPRA